MSHGFTPGEVVTVTNLDAPAGLDEDFEWNTFHYYHDHLDNGVDFCEAGRIQHFDFDYWVAGGPSCDIFNCPDEIYGSEYVHMGRTFFNEAL